MKTALITGITGQDGSYLAELLLEKGAWFIAALNLGYNSNTAMPYELRCLLKDLP